ncbi:uncharacterized protein EI90DRAFT_2186492 [Cantharellus anzutake]|uniref:uncharacterized protein n=1 Tax=Cantharellus anzutake TaxID=1750568 RepID=UPI001903D4E7|nr:uncharacterized protein EI90DRAFT_2186492 [Cantharellus anzutake]KAF8325269.1 hypothetical protein EI90DRAFT_2186492 [Cantharellus anzutake]
MIDCDAGFQGKEFGSIILGYRVGYKVVVTCGERLHNSIFRCPVLSWYCSGPECFDTTPILPSCCWSPHLIFSIEVPEDMMVAASPDYGLCSRAYWSGEGVFSWVTLLGSVGKGVLSPWPWRCVALLLVIRPSRIPAEL